MDHQEIDPRQVEALQAFVDRTLEIAGRQPAEPDLGGQEDLIARQAGSAQAGTDLALVAVHLRRIEVAIAEMQRGFDQFDAQILLERHGAEADGGNTCPMTFNHTHPQLLRPSPFADIASGRRAERIGYDIGFIVTAASAIASGNSSAIRNRQASSRAGGIAIPAQRALPRTAKAASGACSSTLRSARAGPRGDRLPCSQLRTVSTGTPIRAANAAWVRPVWPRTLRA